MDRDWLSKRLAQGKSAAQIGRELGLHPSTVTYWVRRHELRLPERSARHSPRGGIDENLLRDLARYGFSIREIAETMERSPTTIRYWLKRHGIRTSETVRRANRLSDRGPAYVRGLCDRHGIVDFARETRGRYRCVQCRSEAVVRRRRRAKATLLREAGGRCVICGYDRCAAALHFHHLDPKTKQFAIAQHGLGRSIETLRAEAAKCALVCSNCHAEVETGLAELPVQFSTGPG